MIAETLAGIALVKSAVDGIKGAITTANDISDIDLVMVHGKVY